MLDSNLGFGCLWDGFWMFPNHNQMSLKCKPENRAESTFILVFLLWASVILVFNLSSFGMYRTQGRRMTLTLSLRSAHLGSQPIPKYNYNFLNPHVPQTLRYALLQLDSFLHLLTANAMPPLPRFSSDNLLLNQFFKMLSWSFTIQDWGMKE